MGTLTFRHRVKADILDGQQREGLQILALSAIPPRGIPQKALIPRLHQMHGEGHLVLARSD